MPKDPAELAHLEWLGYVQPVGLVVSIPALLAAQAHINRNTAPDHQRLLSCLPRYRNDEVIPEIHAFPQFTQQVLGWEAADDQRQGKLLREVLADDPNHVYAGLLTVLMRLVFILYAEDRGLLPSDPVYANYYAVTGLFERLRADAARFPDTIDLRYGAWAQLLTLFRLIYDGGSHGDMRIPTRRGYLFDPDRYPFLEGKLPVVSSQLSDKNRPPAAPQLTTAN